jgi:uncharacterized protein (UPF0548 family)
VTHDGSMKSGRARTLSERDLTVHLGGVTLSGSRDAAAESRQGFRGYEASVCLGNGATTWHFASTEILRWGVKTRSGFTIKGGDDVTPGEPVSTGQRYWLTARIGPVRIREPVQVVAVIDQADRTGFAYGTLSGHPVSGEEAFVVDRRPDGSVWLTNRSLTGPPSGLWRAAFPVALLAQRHYRRLYLRSLN